MPAVPSIKEDLIQHQILKAAHQLFLKHGFQKVAMDDVARAIGKGRSSLYYYYKSKDEVLDAVVDVEIKDMIEETSSAVDQVDSVEEKIRAFCLSRIRISRKKKAFFNSLEAGMSADEISQYAPKKYAIHKRIRKEETALLRRVFNFGTEEGELPLMDKDTMDTFIFVLLNSLHGVKREMMLDNSFSRLEASVNVLTRMVVEGMKRWD